MKEAKKIFEEHQTFLQDGLETMKSAVDYLDSTVGGISDYGDFTTPSSIEEFQLDGKVFGLAHDEIQAITTKIKALRWLLHSLYIKPLLQPTD